MRRTLIAVFLAAGCIHGSPAVQRDDRALRAIAQQERWAQQALAARPTRAQLDAHPRQRLRGGRRGDAAT